MGGSTVRLWLLTSLFQLVSLTCEQHSNPVEVEVAFQPFPSSPDPDTYTVTCTDANKHLVYVEPIDHSSCSPDCNLFLQIVENPRHYTVTLKAHRNGTTIQEKTFDFSPVSLTSIHLSSTTTSSLLKWKFQKPNTLSTLSLDNNDRTHTFNLNSAALTSQYTFKPLQPGTHFKANIVITTSIKHHNIILKQRLVVGLETAHCPRGWLANGRSCYSVRRGGLAWSDAQQSCRNLAAGSHLADLKTLDDLHFISSHILSHNILLLWTGLTDQQEEGQPLWSDGSVNNLTNAMKSLLPDNQTDCFALQRNATGPGYFLTPFFCHIPLPFICQYQIPAASSSFPFDLVQVTEREAELRWNDLSPLNLLNYSSFEIFLQYQEEAQGDLGKIKENGRKDWTEEKIQRTHSHSRVKKVVKVPISLSSRGVTVAGLFPGSVYSFTLKASHPAGFDWSLGQTRTAYTRPFPPQNVTISSITVNQITARWMLKDAHYIAGWTFVLRYIDLTSRQERIAGMTNIFKSSASDGWHSYTAVIGGLESYKKYSIEVNTVTLHGIESCGQVPLFVQTAVRAPHGLVVTSSTGNLTVCWSSQHDDPPDGYNITTQTLDNAHLFLLWINHSSPDAHWGDETMCVAVDVFSPGQTYEVGVVALRGNDRSQKTSILHTINPAAVQVAVPLSMGSTSVLLYIQRPQLGLIDGVKVCICPGICNTKCEGRCGYVCDWYPLPTGIHNVTVMNLNPGSEYQFKVYSSSRNQTGPPYHTRLIRTSLAPPSRVREGVVTDSSVELLWDPAKGHAQSYEAVCFNCDHQLMVQKVSSQNAVFSGLTPGRLYHFAVRTEKEFFLDSSSITINITAAPSTVEMIVVNKTTSSICISWRGVAGVVSRFILSIKNKTTKQEVVIIHQECRSYIFEVLSPGVRYTIELISISGERMSKPSSVTLYTMPEAPQEVALSEQVVMSAFVSWRPPPGQVDRYKVSFGLISVNRKFWIEVLVHSTSYEIGDLIPGSQYGVSIQSVLGSDTSQAVHREFSTRPAGMCGFHLTFINSSSFSVKWDKAIGEFEFHRITVANTSVTHKLIVPKEEQVAIVTGLRDGCTYNVSAERVRGATKGNAAFLTITTVPAPVRGVRITNVSAHAFSLHWLQAEGCVDYYHVDLLPNQGKVTVHPARGGYIQADVVSVSPVTQYSVTVTAASSSYNSPGVSRMLTTEDRVPGKPSGLTGEAVGSNGILLGWNMPDPKQNIEEYIIRYKEVCPYPDSTFTEVTRALEIPEILLTVFTSGSTYEIQVAGITPAGRGPFSNSLYIKTSESPPSLVTNLTSFAYNHTYVMLTWYLPRRINGLITKFAVKAKNVRTTQLVRMLEVNAEDIMTIALPHCNDAADILSRGTLSPLEITASSPPITLSAVPPAASWSVPISVGVDQLRPYTAYLFEVSAFTSEGEGQIASSMVRMPESAPEDPPQNFTILNMSSRSISVSWNPPSIRTGKFTYMLNLTATTGYVFEEITADTQYTFSDLNPYTKYTVTVRAKAAGELGPAVWETVVTPAEAPSAVQALQAVAEDSVSIRVSWKSPAQPNGLITQYRLLVLEDDILLQDITLTGEQSDTTTSLYEEESFPPQSHVRRKRHVVPSLTTSPPTFTATVSDRTLTSGGPAFTFTHSEPRSAHTDAPPTMDSNPTAHSVVPRTPTPNHAPTSHGANTDIQTSEPADFVTSALSLTSAPPATHPPWLTRRSEMEDMTSASLTTGQFRLSTRDASLTGHYSTRSTAVSGTTGVTVREEVLDVLSEDLSYLVSDLNPFTEYTFKVTASTTVGEGPAINITEKTREQVPSSVLDVSYQNVTSTSILVSWSPPINPNGRITHYTVYSLKLHNNQALKWESKNTSMLITDLDKYTGYKLRVAASTAVGESALSEEDDMFVLTLEDEPDSPPTNLTVIDSSPSTMTLSWSPPDKANGIIQYYEVLYENESYSDLKNMSSNKITLLNLKPFSYYNVSVRAYTRYGHGNQTSDTLHLLSGEDVPGSPPYGLSYESISPSEVNVTWQPPLVPNGILTKYSLELWNSTHYLNLTSDTNHILITHLRKYARYRVKVQAHTRVGPGNYSSEPFNITTLEDAPDTPPQHLHARKLSDYEVELSWQPPLEANSDILYYIVRVWNETNEQWQNVTETSVVINVDSESRYNASVSSWTRMGDGGVLIFISFSTTDAEPFDPPQNITFANITYTSATLMWYPPNEPNGIIVHYTIYYYDNQTYDNQTVIERRVLVGDLSAPASHDSALSYTLTGLMGGTDYTLWMTSSTIQGDGGVQSKPLILSVPVGVPSDSVSNLTVRNHDSTTIIISWDSPLQPNGRLIYLCSLQEAGIPPNAHGPNQGPPAVNKTMKRNTTDNVVLFTKLRKYFPFVFTITPATSAGAAYNHTSTLYLRTDEDIPSSPPLLVSARNLSSSSMAVVWQRPLEANGEIREYTLTLSGPGGSNTTYTSNTSYIFTNLLPYTAYNLTITAATRKGSGPALLQLLRTDEGGPMSPPRNLTIYNHTAFSVWLSWEPPLEPNGVVTHYGFKIREPITHTVTHQNSSGPSTTEYLAGFRPHSSYEISVCSYTRVGHGNQFSSPVTFTTNESVSDAVGNLSCTGVSWDSVQLSWDLPDNPNGQILFYKIVLEIDMQSDTHEADTLEYTVSGLSPEQEYMFTVAAVNSAGPGDRMNCTAFTLSESVPAAPRFLVISEVTSNNVTLQWTRPLSIPGLLKKYQIIAQLLSIVCEADIPTSGSAATEDTLSLDCVSANIEVPLNVSNSTEESANITVQSLLKYRYYRFKVAAVTNAGVGEYTNWIYAHTLGGNPDAPPRGLRVTRSSNSLRIAWDAPAVLSGPTSYLVQVEGPDLNYSTVRAPGETTTVVVTNLTAFTTYFVTVIAFTGPVEFAATDGKAMGPIIFQTMEEEPKDPPKNVTVSVVPEAVNRVKVTFSPPEEPNGNITAYYVYIYQGDRMVKNISINTTSSEQNMLTAVIDGLKGGHSYSIQISAKNGAGKSPPSPHVQITTGIKAPAKPTRRPQAMLGHGGVAMVTHRSITIQMPACFYSDDNGPITKIQVIVAESDVKDSENLTNWKAAFLGRPTPYLTDKGFPNPSCFENMTSNTDLHTSRNGRSLLWENRQSALLNRTIPETYEIGANDNCMDENNTDIYCNGRLKSNTFYVFKFRATNINGQYTDSDYSQQIKTAADGLLTRDEQIIMGVLLSFFLAVLLIMIICCSVKLHQRKKEGETYSPRKAEIIETKCKLDQLIAVADLELKQDKLNRYSSFFFRRKEIYVIQLLSYRKSLKPVNKKSFLQHVEDLCGNDNAKFQEEFSELPKLLQDLATTDADLPCNKPKNRFSNIKPYNNNRVKLLSQPGSEGSDYINASFVSGYLCPNEFIATQGPLPGTVAAFWRMIWETGTRTIAMLTQCFEKGKVRCQKYWPEDDKPMSVFSDILISKVSEQVFPDWTVRTLRVEKHGHYILVRHFNYTSWPEHGVPESCSTFIKFVRAVRTHRHENSTIVVHCSAGVGRTGVFIALDHLIQHVRDHDFVDIYGLVAELRSERMCMVQNLAQYIFLHQSTLELLNNKVNSQSIWFVSYSALEKMDSLDAMEGDVELEWEETTM